MNLATMLKEDTILVRFRAKDKGMAIAGIVDRLVSAGRVPAPAKDAVCQALEAREKISSTALGGGVAIPHATVDAVESIEASLATLSDPIPFGAPENQPVDLIVLLLVPRARARQYASILADVARLLSRKESREAILAARTAHEALDIMARESSGPAKGVSPK